MAVNFRGQDSVNVQNFMLREGDKKEKKYGNDTSLNWLYKFC